MEELFIVIALIVVLLAVAVYVFFVRGRLARISNGTQSWKKTGTLLRSLLTAMIFGGSYALIGIPLDRLPLERDMLAFANWIPLILASAIGWWVWVRLEAAPAKLVLSALRGLTVAGGIAFAVSALSGPILFSTKPNQGVLVGLFYSGPAFALLGCVGGVVTWLSRVKSERADS